MNNQPRIDQTADEFLHEKLYEVVYRYIADGDCQRLFDSFRGSLDVFFHLEMIPADKYIFLLNFIRWLEHKGEFGESEDDVFRIFYDSFVEDLQNNYDKGI